LFDLGCLTRDGVRLSSDVFLPAHSAPAPAVLLRTPYEKTRSDFVEWAKRFATHGYSFVIQDVRGRGDSDGVFTPWSDEFDDGYDAVEWVAARPWCDGQVGMLGGSYLAWVQWAAAARHPPHLRTLVTSGSPGRWFRDWPYRFGALWAEDYVEWVNRVSARLNQPATSIDWSEIHENRRPRAMDTVLGRPMPHWQECLDHATFDEFWQRLTITGYDAMDFPALHITGWFDACAPGEFHHFREMIAASPAAGRQSLLLGAWDHGGACTTGQAVAGALDLGAASSLDLPGIWLAWFDRWLRNRGGATWPTVRYFAMGANAWRDADGWPPSDAEERSVYLTAEGRLALQPPESPSASAFQYDPSDPTPAMASLTADPLPEWSPREIDFLEQRPDVLVFTSDPLPQPLEVAGPVRLEVFASSSAVDTDFAAVLADVGLDERAILVSHGILRASFRDSLTHPTPLVPEECYPLTIELTELGHMFQPGHSLRLIVTSCLFPYYHPNPNTGASYGDELAGEYTIAKQTIHAGGDRPSRLVVCARSQVLAQ
jgi:putative CocE/NonD family hydrolase